MTIEDGLALMVYALVPVAWVSAVILGAHARQTPRIAVLTERTIIGIIIAIFLTSIAVIIANTEAEEAFFPLEIARSLFRLSVIGLGIVPAAWLVLFLAGRLDSDE